MGKGWKKVRRIFLVVAVAILVPYLYLDNLASQVVGQEGWKWSAGILGSFWALVAIYELAVFVYSKFAPSRIDKSRYTSVFPNE